MLEMYWGEVTVEVAGNLLRAVILHLNTRGHCGAVWRSGGGLRGQQGGFGRSVASSQAGRLQGRHGGQDVGGSDSGRDSGHDSGGDAAAGARGGGGSGVSECVWRTLWVRVRRPVLCQCVEGRQGGGGRRLSAGEDGRTLGVLVEAGLTVDARPRVRLVGWLPTWTRDQGRDT